MTVNIDILTSPPARVEMNSILGAYYGWIIPRLVALGGPDVDPARPIADFWDHLPDFMPPNGCICLARSSTDDVVGCGTLSSLPGGRGELKRLYVRGAARGTGAGRLLVEKRIALAKEMGLSRLLVDTLTVTTAMQGLYRSLGFQPIDRYPESSTANAFPELRPHMLYFALDLD